MVWYNPADDDYDWFNAALYDSQQLQRYETNGITDEERERDMVSTSYLEKRIELLSRELEKRLEVEARFGKNSDYEDYTIIVWNQRFEKNGLIYTFTALKAAGAWYTSSLFQRSRMSFEELIEKHLSAAETVWIVTEMEEL